MGSMIFHLSAAAVLTAGVAVSNEAHAAAVEAQPRNGQYESIDRRATQVAQNADKAGKPEARRKQRRFILM